MSKRMYVGVDGEPRKVKKIYVGVDSEPRKVKKGYVGVDGKARLFFLDRYFEYSGDYTSQEITIDGAAYILYTLKGNGTLTCSDSRFWMCGGGGGGASATYSYSGGGGGGGYVNSGEIEGGTYDVVIGPGGAANTNGGATSIGSIVAEGGKRGVGRNGGDGGSGGGGADYLPPSAENTRGEYGEPGSGAGIETYPFGIKDVEGICAHCGGGAGGNASFEWETTDTYGYLFANTSRGMVGGSNGGNGGIKDNVWHYNGVGGEYGGGDSMDDATYYGGGGGGGVCYQRDVHVGRRASGTGYQGVAYILQSL